MGEKANHTQDRPTPTTRKWRSRGNEGEPCPDCGEPLRSGGYCWACEHDQAEERREFHAWREYVRDYRDKMGAIAKAAEQVCDAREQELIAAYLLGWSEEHTAEHLGLSVKALRTFRADTHEKIRAGIGPERLAELMKRRRDI